jgi:hypothetical protein
MLPEIVEPAVSATDVVRLPSWEHAVGEASGTHAVLAIGSGVVAFASNGRLCGYAEADGARRWCVAGGTAPAYAADQIAFTTAGGGSASVAARDGRALWRHGRPAARRSPHERSDLEAVWSTGIDFLVQRSSGDMYEVSPAGAELWSAHIDGTHDPLIAAPSALLPVVGDGAIISVSQYVVRLGRRGGAGPDFDAWQIATVDPPYAFVTLSPMEESEDHFFTLDIGRADLRSGTIDPQFHFEPDYDVNSAYYARTGMIDGLADTAQAPVRFDGARFYATVGHNVYRYEFAEPRTQHPLLVARDAQLLGGPYRGAIFVARHGGVWSLHPQARAIIARLVAPSAADVVRFTLAGRAAFVALRDGTVRGFDAESGRPFLDARPCDASHDIRIAVSRQHAYVVCASGPGMRVFAFALDAG